MLTTPEVIEDGAKGKSVNSYVVSANFKPYIDRILVTKGQLKDRIARLAEDIHGAYVGQSLDLLCVKDGAVDFCADLDHHLASINHSNPAALVKIKLHGVKIKSMDGTVSTGEYKLIEDADDPLSSLKGKNVVVVEDIVDSGGTMLYLLEQLSGHAPKSVRVASLLYKRNPVNEAFLPDFYGFSIPNEFVIGCGLDYNDEFRKLPHLCVINEHGIQTFSRIKK